MTAPRAVPAGLLRAADHPPEDVAAAPAPSPATAAAAERVASIAPIVNASVSVILPVYNAGLFLRPALNSLLPDLGPDVELIIVDDGSSDGSTAVAEEYARRRGVDLLVQANAGLAAALNAGIAASKAPLIARMDADDINVAGRIAAARKLFDDRERLGLVSCFAEILDEEDVVVGRLSAPWLSDDALRDLRYVGNNVVHGAAVLRRDAYEEAGGYREGQGEEDYDLWLRMTQRWEVALVPEYLYRYRRHSASMTGRGGAAMDRAARVLNDRAWAAGPPAVPRPFQARARHRLYRRAGGEAAAADYCSSLVQLAGEGRKRGQLGATARAIASLAMACPASVLQRGARGREGDPPRSDSEQHRP